MSVKYPVHISSPLQSVTPSQDNFELSLSCTRFQMQLDVAAPASLLRRRTAAAQRSKNQKPSACSSCSNQSKPIGLTMRLLTTTMRASFFGSALKCWCAQYG